MNGMQAQQECVAQREAYDAEALKQVEEFEQADMLLESQLTHARAQIEELTIERDELRARA